MEFKIKEELPDTEVPIDFIDVEMKIECSEENPSVEEYVREEDPLDLEVKPELNIKTTNHTIHQSKSYEQRYESQESLKDSFCKRKSNGIVDLRCDQCDFKAARSGSLKSHKKRKHESKDKGICYPCDQCDYKATRFDYLKSHKESIHEGVRYPCDQCDFKTTTSQHLQWHKQCKHDQRDYKGTTFRSFMRHKESKHKGVCYPCDQCEYKATRSANLKKHKENKHEGVRYPCDQCEYKATQSGNLRSHKERKHK